ncbi:sensor histidine kinase [Aliidiomarina iranensis]|uniref:histidine kinase n=1 Tax=Aliidiomarina iranensis TaxID=1434071 RepID=A0A432VWH7_9GAMM|nr:HAMP domain-containing sensor histidine kinase [Aliidiomarina iranensis]RUO20942.1 sensor histidine kinase [Aliidiomarina iranensis]
MRLRRTRWYQSLTIRLLAIFWALILLTAIAAFSVVLYLSRPPGPSPMAEDFPRALQPILNHASTVGMIQPGRLLVGDYRVVAVDSPDNSDIQYIPGLGQTEVGVAFNILQSPEPIQTIVADRTYAGPLGSSAGAVVMSRTATNEELAALVAAEDQDWLPRLILMAFGASFLGALILGWWFVRPLKQLRDATREIATGSAEPNLARLPKRKDELGELARTMNATAIELANSRDAQRRLLSDVSHELRSPLARLQVALDLMETDTLKTDRNYMQLNKDIYRLGSIIDSILWLSRLENGLDKLVKGPVNVFALLEELRNDLYYMQYGKGQQNWDGRLTLPEQPIPEIETDGVLLRLVLENLIRNGFQYGPDNGVVIVSAEVVKQEKSTNSPNRKGNKSNAPAQKQQWLEITVKDEGPGVPADKLQKMFEPFYRADPSRHHGAGVGLGLALCQRATAVLDGEITAINHAQGGLAVSVRLPLEN